MKNLQHHPAAWRCSMCLRGRFNLLAKSVLEHLILNYTWKHCAELRCKLHDEPLVLLCAQPDESCAVNTLASHRNNAATFTTHKHACVKAGDDRLLIACKTPRAGSSPSSQAHDTRTHSMDLAGSALRLASLSPCSLHQAISSRGRTKLSAQQHGVGECMTAAARCACARLKRGSLWTSATFTGSRPCSAAATIPASSTGVLTTWRPASPAVVSVSAAESNRSSAASVASRSSESAARTALQIPVKVRAGMTCRSTRDSLKDRSSWSLAASSVPCVAERRCSGLHDVDHWERLLTSAGGLSFLSP